MSLEPSTSAKVAFETTKGRIEVDLWARELPEISKCFIQNCLNKSYVGCTFNTISKDTIQLTDIKDTEESESFRNKFNSRLRFSRRGILGAIRISENKHSVDSFFITLKEMPEYNNKYIVLGYVTAESMYNVLKISGGELDDNGRPLYPVEIKDVMVSTQFFEHLSPKALARVNTDVEPAPKKQKRKQIKLGHDLSRAMGEEEEEEDSIIINPKISSAYDAQHAIEDTSIQETSSGKKELQNNMPSAAVGEVGPSNDTVTKLMNIHEDTKTNIEAGTDDKINHDNVDLKENIAAHYEEKGENNAGANEEDYGTEALEDREEPFSESETISENDSVGEFKLDPTIDSDYDSDLDLHEAESIRFEDFKNTELHFRSNVPRR